MDIFLTLALIVSPSQVSTLHNEIARYRLLRKGAIWSLAKSRDINFCEKERFGVLRNRAIWMLDHTMVRP